MDNSQTPIDRLAEDVKLANGQYRFGPIPSPIKPPTILGLHPLKGSLKSFWSVPVSGNWRVIFRFENGNASDVDDVDYHCTRVHQSR
jgi:hypothetical protein